MEMTILLLLTVPFTYASPLRSTQRTQSDSFLSEAGVQTPEVKRSEVTQEGRLPQLRIIPFHSEGKQQDLETLKHRIALKLRPKRTSQRGGCQLGTCQLHNLANTLYQIGNTSGKDESKNAHDPQGFGR